MLYELNLRPQSAVHDFLGIPVLSSWFRHPLDPTLWCVDSEISVTDAQGQTHSFFGHAAGSGLQRTLRRADYEFCERMLASRAFVPSQRYDRGFAGRRLFGGGSAGLFSASSVLVREAPAAQGPQISASGLGLHRRIGQAIEHACFELIERHVLMSMWYLEKEKLASDGVERLPQGYQIRYYATPDGLPFALAVLCDEDRSVFFCGSSVRSGIEAAKTHARNEALHLFSNFLVKGIAPSTPSSLLRGNVAASIERLALLHGASARAMHAHLDTRIVMRAARAAKASTLKGILETRFRRLDDAAYVTLGRWRQLVTVRVLVPEALTKNRVRQRFCGTGIVTDPFC